MFRRCYRRFWSGCSPELGVTGELGRKRIFLFGGRGYFVKARTLSERQQSLGYLQNPLEAFYGAL